MNLPGQLNTATHMGQSGIQGEGPYIRIWVQLESGIVKDASFECNGCPSAILSGAAMSTLLVNRRLEQVQALESREFVALIQGLPEGKEYYADMAMEAVRNIKHVTEKTSCQ